MVARCSEDGPRPPTDQNRRSLRAGQNAASTSRSGYLKLKTEGMDTPLENRGAGWHRPVLTEEKCARQEGDSLLEGVKVPRALCFLKHAYLSPFFPEKSDDAGHCKGAESCRYVSSGCEPRLPGEAHHIFRDPHGSATPPHRSRDQPAPTQRHQGQLEVSEHHLRARAERQDDL